MGLTKLVFTSTLSFLFLAAYSAPEPQGLKQTIKGAYYPSWAQNMPPSNINTDYFTHIFYAFLVPNNTTFTFDITPDLDKSLKTFTAALRDKNPPVGALFSIGGGGVDPSLFSRMASSQNNRAAFIQSSIKVARKYKFAGFDLDYEFPQNTFDMANLGHLLKEWRAAVKAEASQTKLQPLLITAAVYYSAGPFLSGPPRSYPAAQIQESLDWVNMMDYDYHGSWDANATGEHAQLYDRTGGKLSTSYGVDSWIRAGVSPNKMVMGFPLYGKTYTLKNKTMIGIGAPAKGVGPGVDGIMTYSEVVDFYMKLRKKRKNKVEVFFDARSVSMYAVAGKVWIGFDGFQSVFAKVQYAKDKGLRGYFFWAVNGDSNWTLSRTASETWKIA